VLGRTARHRRPLSALLSVVLGAAGLGGILFDVRGGERVPASSARPVQEQAAHPSFAGTVRPFVERHCLACHSNRVKTGGLSLEGHVTAEHALQEPELWRRIGRRVRNGEMPPVPMPRPDPADADAVVRWLESQLGRLEDARADPGRVTARRLNRAEYDNTVRDLIGIGFRPADDFPADDVGYGFDNIGDVLSMSPILLEKYLAAAEKISQAAIPSASAPEATADQYLTTGLRHEFTHNFPVRADYEIFVNVIGKRPKDAPPQTLNITLDGRAVGSFVVEASKIDNGVNLNPGFMVRLPVDPGKRRIAVALVAPGENKQATELFDREIRGLDAIVVKGPFDPRLETSESHGRLFVCGHERGKHEPACARLVLGTLARRAYRRPVAAAEVERLLQFVARAESRGDPFEEGVRLALQAVLVSPRFLFRIEHDPNPGDPAAVHPVTDHELAARLSYFLWSSMPDAQLSRLADEGRLRQPGVLDSEVDRMLADSRAFTLAENFAGQWLKVRNLDTIKPDPDRFPEFDEELRAAMRQETRLFFETVVRENRSIMDFIDGKFTFVNERLARHYGIRSVRGPGFRRVTLAGRQRSGVITQASVLTVSSYPTRTSPVLRGKWILDNIVNAPPPPPPTDVPNLNETAIGTQETLRAQLLRHRKAPACASCHAPMDPLGFGLENYDAIGAWRTRDGAFPIDCSGKLPDGKSFSTPAQLKRILRTEEGTFARGLTERMLTYALGRGLEPYDDAAVGAITEEMARDSYRFRSLIRGVVNSAPFQMRRSEGVKP